MCVCVNTGRPDRRTLALALAHQVYPVGIPLLYAWQLFKHRHRIYPKQALRDGVSPERRLGDKKIAHTVVLWEVRVRESFVRSFVC